MKKAMKMVALFVCAMATVALTGCGKDNEDLILGKWNVDKNIVSYTWEGQTETEEEDLFVSFEFKADGTGTVEGYLDEEEVKGEGVTETLPMTWKMNEEMTVITITVDGDSESFTITELTNKKCTLTMDMGFLKLEVFMTKA